MLIIAMHNFRVFGVGLASATGHPEGLRSSSLHDYMVSEHIAITFNQTICTLTVPVSSWDQGGG